MNKNKSLKTEDIQSIRRQFYQKKVLTRQELSQKTGLSPAAVTNILQNLMQKQEILYVSDAPSTGGRRQKQYVLNPEYAHIALVCAFRQKETCRFDVQSVNLADETVIAYSLVSEEGSYEDLKKVIEKVLHKDACIQAVVLSIPGVCQKGQIISCDVHGLEGKDLNNICSCLLVVENDVNTACIGFSHCFPQYKNIALIYQPAVEYAGTGIMINGRLYNGSSHAAGEMKYLHHELPGERLKDPEEALVNDISALKAVLDPQMIGWSSDLLHEDVFAQDKGLVHIQSMDKYIRIGLYEIGKELLFRRGG